MIAHIVMLSLDAAPDDRLADVMDGLARLVGDIPGFTVFQHGPNRDFENKSPDHPYGFICTFTDAASLQAYAADPRHRRLGAELVALCTGGADGIVVYDLETGAA